MTVVGVTNSLNPTAMFLGVICIVLFAGVLLQTKKLNRYKGNPFVDMYLDCEESGAPLGLITDKSGKVLYFKVERSEKNDALLESPSRWTMITSDISNEVAQSRINGGPELNHYFMPFPFPVSIKSAAALCGVARMVREHPRLSILRNERDVISSMCDNTKAFEYNCAAIISTYIDGDNCDRLPKEYLQDGKQTKKPVESITTQENIETDENVETQEDNVDGAFISFEDAPAVIEQPVQPKKVEKSGFLAKLALKKGKKQ